jgi:hypothetical protein
MSRDGRECRKFGRELLCAQLSRFRGSVVALMGRRGSETEESVLARGVLHLVRLEPMTYEVGGVRVTVDQIRSFYSGLVTIKQPKRAYTKKGGVNHAES